MVAHATHRHAHLHIHRHAFAGPGFRLEIPGGGTLEVGPGVQFRRDFYCEISGDGRVSIGAGTIFGVDATIQCSTSVEIGEGCLIGSSVTIADGSHRFRDWSKSVSAQGYDFRPIVIGTGALVHSNCTIVASVGYRAVIGANSLVNKAVPDYTLVGGVPARVLEYFGPPGEDGVDG
jgi:acetyltransferase-like isoleucine patch superfamily enzyme